MKKENRIVSPVMDVYPAMYIVSVLFVQRWHGFEIPPPPPNIMGVAGRWLNTLIYLYIFNALS